MCNCTVNRLTYIRLWPGDPITDVLDRHKLELAMRVCDGVLQNLYHLALRDKSYIDQLRSMNLHLFLTGTDVLA